MEQGNEIRKNIIYKMVFVYIFILAVVVLIIGQIIYLQSIPADEWADKLKTERTEIKYTKRGDILSSDGYYLAASVPVCSAFWDLKVVKKDTFYKYIDTLAACMSDYFKDQPKEYYKEAFTNAQKAGKRYFKIKTGLTTQQLNHISRFPIFRMAKNKSGFIRETDYKRKVIDNLMARRTIGGPDTNGVFTIGIEGAYNDILKGNKYVQLSHKLSSGDFVPYDMWEEEDKVPGYDVVSSINLNMQDMTEKSLLKQLQKFQARAGTAVVMEVKTGKIRAMINLLRDSATGRYAETRILAVAHPTEPGSTFKLASMIAILESGAYDINDTIDTGNGTLVVSERFPMSDDHKDGLGKLTVKEVFSHSSNVGFGIMAINAFDNTNNVYVDPRLNNRKKNRSINYFYDLLYNMKLNEPTGIKIKGEPRPGIYYPDRNSKFSVTTLPQNAIGYELKVTPLQTLTLYNAVANNGVMVRPQTIESVKLYGETIQDFETEIINPSICSESTLKKVQEMLVSVVEDGTAQNIRSDKYQIAGKTGTAQIFKGKVKTGKHQASFAGYFPADNPKYSCIVVIYAPEGNIYGNRVAAPVFKEIADKIYTSDYDMQRKEFNLAKLEDTRSVPFTRIGNRAVVDRILSRLHVEVITEEQSNTTWVQTRPTEDHKKLYVDSYTPIHGTIPNVKGMGLKDALYVLRSLDIAVKVVGHGVVKKQSIPPDTQIKKGMSITIELG
ncbi:MAG: PASTA domain-containing protein [Bacteroidales bacterium]|nr:PASTA domain-containing protein [Bacteroidales bacterium]